MEFVHVMGKSVHTLGDFGDLVGGWGRAEDAGGFLLTQQTEISIGFLMEPTACGRGRGDQIWTRR